jgi:hypothetical protein
MQPRRGTFARDGPGWIRTRDQLIRVSGGGFGSSWSGLDFPGHAMETAVAADRRLGRFGAFRCPSVAHTWRLRAAEVGLDESPEQSKQDVSPGQMACVLCAHNSRGNCAFAFESERRRYGQGACAEGTLRGAHTDGRNLAPTGTWAMASSPWPQLLQGSADMLGLPSTPGRKSSEEPGRVLPSLLIGPSVRPEEAAGSSLSEDPPDPKSCGVVGR